MPWIPISVAASAALSAIAPFFVSERVAAEPSSLRPWTLLVYGAADNNADGPILEFLDRVRASLDDDPGLELVLFLDRHEGFSNDATLLGEDFEGARLYRLRRDSAERLEGGAEFPEMTLEGDLELDSADPEVLEKFVLFGKARFPAARYGLLIYSHANGQTMCPDDESGREMGIPELSEVVSDRASVDFLALELCNMGGIEIGYQWRPGTGRFGADVLLAIPNAGPPLDWHRAFDRIRSAGHSTDAEGPTLDPSVMTAADFGNLVIEEGARGRAEMAKNHPERAESVRFESAASYDLRKAAAVKKAVDALASTLAIGDPENAFEELRGSHSRSCAIRYTGSEFGAHPYVDLYDLASRAAESERLSEAVRSRAREAMAATDEFVLSSFGMDGLAGFEPGKSGVFLVYPTWQRLDWYVPRRAETGEAAFGGWSFLRDGASEGNRVVENWYELLGYWYETHDSY